MTVNVGALRPVTACLLAGLLVVGAAQPAAAAPRRAEQWYLDELRIDQAHKISTGRGVVVAVIDTGVEASHPDLRGQVLAGGRSYGASGDGRADEDGHGTHMAGIIAAKKPARDGVDGIAPGVKILPIKLDARRDEVYAVRRRAGQPRHPDGRRRWRQGDQHFHRWQAVAPPTPWRSARSSTPWTMTSSWSPPPATPPRAAPRSMLPPTSPGVIAVTGTTRGGAFWSGSVQGPEAVVAAPGDGIYNVGRREGYGWGDGTSDSTAIVSGLAALIRSKYPNLDAPNVINRIIRTARDAGPAGRDPQYGFGLIDPVTALTANVPPVTANPLLDPAAATADPAPTRTAGPGRQTADAAKEFDVTQHGDRGGPTDQQVMVVVIGVAVVLVLLLGLVVFLIWNRRRYRREAALAANIPDHLLDQAASRRRVRTAQRLRTAQGYPPPGAGYAPPPGYAATFRGTPRPAGYTRHRPATRRRVTARPEERRHRRPRRGAVTGPDHGGRPDDLRVARPAIGLPTSDHGCVNRFVPVRRVGSTAPAAYRHGPCARMGGHAGTPEEPTIAKKPQPEGGQAPVVQRVRIRYAKRGPLRFTSHRDFARAFERALRRAAVPIAFSQGFTPHPKISYASAAPTGVASEAEYLEIGLAGGGRPGGAAGRVGRRALAGAGRAGRRDRRGGQPAGPDRGVALAHRVARGRHRRSLRAAVDAFLAADEVLVERMTKQGRRTFDARAAVMIGRCPRANADAFRGAGRTVCDTRTGRAAGHPVRTTR